MDNADVLTHIEELVAEEHRLLDAGESGTGLSDEQHERLKAVRVELDRYWDLLRRRRAREEFGFDDSGETELRDARTVESYEQ